MEKINQRDMRTFVLSSLINFGIGWVIGLILGIIILISNNGNNALETLLDFPISFGLLFAFITGNMYRLYFYYRLSLDINTVCEGDGQESESYVIAAVLSTLTFGIYHIYWVYKLAQRLRANAPRYGFKMMETGKEIAVLDALSFGYIAAWELIKNTNKIAKVYNQNGLAEVVGGVQ